jgi:hypothetical protein
MLLVNMILMRGKNNTGLLVYFRKENDRKLTGKKMILVNTILMRGKNNILDKKKTVICG